MQLRLMRDEVARGSGPPTRPGRCVLLDPTGRGSAHPGAPGRLAADGAGRDPSRARPGARRARTRRVRGPRADAGHASDRGLVGDRPLRCRPGAPHHRGGAGVVARTIALAPAPSHDRPVLLACGPRSLHTLGLEALAGLLAYQGRGVGSLGARTPERTLVTAAIATDAAAVVVVCTSPPSADRRGRSAPCRRGEPRTGVLRRQRSFSQALAAMPGTYLGDSLATAADVRRPSRSARTGLGPGGPGAGAPLAKDHSPMIARMPATYGATASVSPARDST